MRILIFGASGMVGQGVLRECLRSEHVDEVVTVGRSLIDADELRNAAKLMQLTPPSLFDLSTIAPQLHEIDACFYCIGVSALGMSEAEYKHITCELTISIAKSVKWLNPQVIFVYVSGQGTDSTEKSKTMWARVKGETENSLLAMDFPAAYMFRPGLIIPGKGIQSKTAMYRVIYQVLGPILPLLRQMFPQHVTTTSQVGRAMLSVARKGYPKQILEQADISTF